ncbi:MAG TPA: hypothetical protein VGH17_09210 [Candidatus Acidoferrales bacterium]|jgi:hypothetical protein
MSAINFPLTIDISSAANQVSSQNAEQLPTGGSGQSSVLRPDTVTLSAVFPPPPPVDAANFVQFQSPAPPALEAFPPAQTAKSPARLAPVADATTAPTPSQQEQLAQLNRVLEQLGINPQSISLDNRLALVKSANDPPALLNLVRTLGALDQATTSEQISASSANNLSNLAPTVNQAQAPAQNESQAQPPLESPAPLQSSSPSAGSGFGSISSAAGGAASSPSDQPAPASNVAAQFQQLQAVFQEAGNAQDQSGAAGSGATPQPSLNIRV